jgi:transcriptional regulator of nitric oxide reductase/ferredoxin
MVFYAATVVAQTPDDARSVFARIFPSAESFGSMTGTPPAAPAYREGAVAGYVFFTRAVVGSVGFSGKPFDVAVGIDMDGRLTGAEIVAHQEPILAIGVTPEALRAFPRQYRDIDIRTSPKVGKGRDGTHGLDAVSGATVSSLVINDAIIRAARTVARNRGIIGRSGATLDLDSFTPADWQGLLREGALAHLNVSNAALDQALAARGGRYGPAGLERVPNDTFIDLYVGLATPVAIGRNLMGARAHDRLSAELKPGEQALFVASSGLFSFKGRQWRRTGIFERVQLVQGERTFKFTGEGHKRIEVHSSAAAPRLRESALFIVPNDSGFDPTKPWRLELLVTGEGAAGPVHAVFALPYRVPSRLVRSQTEITEPLWIGAWRARLPSIAILVAMLITLSLILVFQDAMVRRVKFFRAVRVAFLSFTVVWLGWIAGAQLSVVNVLTFASSLLTGFQWEVFLVAPLIFILWGYVAVTLLFWGRGVLCGWLCPFGAMQELLNGLARRLKFPQIKIPFLVHERLWPVKYMIFLGIFALSLGGLDRVQEAIEIEPFKTAISLHFNRAWPFVAYTVALLAVGLFIERAFCRYLCPLGAALAIPARLRMFEWLKRKRDCGAPCQVCAARCPVQAIHPEGHINPNECVYCLNCQVWYYDDHICPPLVDRRKRREARAEAARQRAERTGT